MGVMRISATVSRCPDRMFHSSNGVGSIAARGYLRRGHTSKSENVKRTSDSYPKAEEQQ